MRDAPVLLFMLDTPFETALVAGAAERGRGGDRQLSENTVEESQRRALRRMHNFTAANQHTWVDSAHFERVMPWDGEESMQEPRQAHAMDSYN